VDQGKFSIALTDEHAAEGRRSLRRCRNGKVTNGGDARRETLIAKILSLSLSLDWLSRNRRVGYRSATRIVEEGPSLVRCTAVAVYKDIR